MVPSHPATEPAPDLLAEASQRLIRTVDGLEDEAWARPSGLPGWSRAHVIAHLVLNAEGLTGALRGLVAGEPTPMYRSQEARNSDIDELASADPAELRDRLLGATTELADAIGAVPEDLGGAVLERVPGGARTFRAATAPGMRLSEVEIHHADLDVGYTAADWPPVFAASVVDSMRKRDSWSTPFTGRATDLDRSWTFGAGAEAGPTVSGTAADLAWWLTGRGSGEGLTSDGELPGIEGW
ncbi:maleylpyruvate isomerase family mycothiol-dependent enzyme [Nocardioides panaciterrulae]|uniref:Maleylpyruvate isomerase n=1 Tax=Nocardioides panaciterrulae TaxID=661492 RepID=A0A7Y9JAE1_9ACTN|nr:maleylpyruvate isomerase family mycothiol-dependent enzyme [Nocardioides panaciterrulae]NYD41710.1 maleylpyruvate isomerase [Nocardioides panaciterrulae]